MPDPETDDVQLLLLDMQTPIVRAGAVPSSLTSFATGLVEDMGTGLGGAVMKAVASYQGWSA